MQRALGEAAKRVHALTELGFARCQSRGIQAQDVSAALCRQLGCCCGWCAMQPAAAVLLSAVLANLRADTRVLVMGQAGHLFELVCAV